MYHCFLCQFCPVQQLAANRTTILLHRSLSPKRPKKASSIGLVFLSSSMQQHRVHLTASYSLAMLGALIRIFEFVTIPLRNSAATWRESCVSNNAPVADLLENQNQKWRPKKVDEMRWKCLTAFPRGKEGLSLRWASWTWWLSWMHRSSRGLERKFFSISKLSVFFTKPPWRIHKIDMNYWIIEFCVVSGANCHGFWSKDVHGSHLLVSDFLLQSITLLWDPRPALPETNIDPWKLLVVRLLSFGEGPFSRGEIC